MGSRKGSYCRPLTCIQDMDLICHKRILIFSIHNAIAIRICHQRMGLIFINNTICVGILITIGQAITVAIRKIHTGSEGHFRFRIQTITILVQGTVVNMGIRMLVHLLGIAPAVPIKICRRIVVIFGVQP